MKSTHPSNTGSAKTAFIAAVLAFTAAALPAGLYVKKLNQKLTLAQSDLSNAKKELTDQITALQSDLDQARGANADLLLNLSQEKNLSQDFQNKISELSGTVEELQKLSKTDKEFLQKYSKVYFLNEHFVPEPLVSISTEYTLNGKPILIQERASAYLRQLLIDAREARISLVVNSAYRSFSDQQSVKSGYKVTYGAGTANQFSAEQGYSEHQLGTAVDFSYGTQNTLTLSFGKSDAFKWLRDNAHKYGFVLSYPENNAYYQYEPWHWRFVGTKLATFLKEEGKYFYDMDQREINQYLLYIFD